MSKSFVIDLTNCTTTADIMEKICSTTESNASVENDVVLKLKDFQLNQSQLLSIKLLIESYNSCLTGVIADSLITKQLAESMGLKILSADEVENIENENDFNASIDALFKVPIKPDESDESDMPEPEISDIEDNNNESDINENEDVENTGSEDFYKPVNVSEDESVSPSADDGFVQKSLFEDVTQTQAAQEETQKEVQETVQEETSQDEVSNEAADAEVPEDEVPQEIPQEEAVASDTESIADDEEGERKTIGVYTKAYDETDTDEIYEEVDFYAPPSSEPVVVDTKQTMYISQTLRSGQTVEYDGNVLIIGDCHPGSEIKATGDITVWGVLGSIAHAGIKGNKEAKIRALKMNAIQLRIADCYSRRPDGTNIPYIVKSSSFIPEEARLVDNNIVLYKMT